MGWAEHVGPLLDHPKQQGQLPGAAHDLSISSLIILVKNT
jgi:hypothetical protein